MKKTILNGFYLFCLFFGLFSQAAVPPGGSNGGGKSISVQQVSSPGSSYSSSEIFLDVSAHYVRDIEAYGDTDTAARLSIGGQFAPWIGLDFVGLYQKHAKNYLIGADLRLKPTEWFFLKGGVGGYSDKVSKAIQLAPLAGAGILGRLSSSSYVVAEANYFQVNLKNFLSFGIGLGLIF